MPRNADVNLFLLDDQIEEVRRVWSQGMCAMKDSSEKKKTGGYKREADWTTRIKMMAFWKDCTVIRSRETDATYKDVKQAFDLAKVRAKQRKYQDKVN